MFILPNQPQSISQLLGKTVSLCGLTYHKIYPFVLILVFLFDTPALSQFLWGHDILNSTARFIGFELIEALATMLLLSIMLHQAWGLMHNRQRALNVSTTYVYARALRIVIWAALFCLAISVLSWAVLHASQYLGVGHPVLLVNVSWILILYFVMRFYFVLPWIIAKDLSLREALRKSWYLTQGRMGKVWLFSLFMLGLFLGAHFLLAYLSGHSQLGMLLLDSLLTAVLLLFFNAQLILLFHDLRLQQEASKVSG